MENEDKGRKNEVLGNRGDVSDGPVIRKLWFQLFHQQSNIVQGHFFCFFFFFVHGMRIIITTLLISKDAA